MLVITVMIMLFGAVGIYGAYMVGNASYEARSRQHATGGRQPSAKQDAWKGSFVLCVGEFGLVLALVGFDGVSPFSDSVAWTAFICGLGALTVLASFADALRITVQSAGRCK